MQKWQIELAATPLWLLQTFCGVLLALLLTVFLFSKTRFGKQFWQILKPVAHLGESHFQSINISSQVFVV